MLCADHILQDRIIICPKAEYDKRLPEGDLLRIEGENL